MSSLVSVQVASAAGGPGTPFSSSGSTSNLPAGCSNAFSDGCYHMRGGLNGLDSPQIDVLLIVPASPYAERDLRAMHQVIDMYEAGIQHIAAQEGMDWLADGVDFHVTPMVVDPTKEDGGEFSTYPLIDPEIVVIRGNPFFVPVGLGAILGIGIDPLAPNQAPCHGVANPFDIEQWEAVPGFDSHHDGRGGTYREDCDGRGGNVCFAINGGLEPAPGIDLFGIDVFDLVAHEVGHCLRLGHVGDAGTEFTAASAPLADIMSYTGQSHRKCVSSLDVEVFAVAMSPFLDVDGNGALNTADRLYHNDHIGEGGNPFQVQLPQDHYYASATGLAQDCPQPDVGIQPLGAPVDFRPSSSESGGATLSITTPDDGDVVESGVAFNVAGTADPDGGSSTSTSTSSTSTSTSSSSTGTGTTTTTQTGTQGCAGGLQLAADGTSDSTGPKATEVHCLGASYDGTRFAFHLAVADKAARTGIAGSYFYDLYFSPQFGTLAGTTQLVSVEIPATGAPAPFWDVGGNDPTGLTFPAYAPDPTREDVTASWSGNDLKVSFPISYLGAPANGDDITGIQVDTNYCVGNPCDLQQVDFVPDGTGSATVTFTGGNDLASASARPAPALLSVATVTSVLPKAPPVRQATAASTAPTTQALFFHAPAGPTTAAGTMGAVVDGRVDDAYVATITAAPPAYDNPAVYIGHSAGATLAPNPFEASTGALPAGTVIGDGNPATQDTVTVHVCMAETTQTAFVPRTLVSVYAGNTLLGRRLENDLAIPYNVPSCHDATVVLGRFIDDQTPAGNAPVPVTRDTNGDIPVPVGQALRVTVDADTAFGGPLWEFVYDSDTYPAGVTFTSSVQAAATERIEVRDGATLLGTATVDTSGASAAVDWSLPVTLSGTSTPRTLTATWKAADGTVLDTDTVSVQVGADDPCDGVTQAPAISNIAWSATASSATITWSTDRDASARLDHGTSASYGSHVAPAGVRTQHSVTLSGLAADTTYHYRIQASDCDLTAQTVDNELQTAEATPFVSVTTPADGAEDAPPVSFGGAFDASEEPRTREGVGLVTEQDFTRLELQEALQGASWQKAAARLGKLPGFAGAYPIDLDGRVALAFVHERTGDEPAFTHGWTILYEQARPQILQGHSDTPVRVHTVEQALERWQQLAAEPTGPHTPGLQTGLGPGTALRQGQGDEANFVCTASYLFVDPVDPSQYYLATAGHCLLKDSWGVDKTGLANPADVNDNIQLCFANCVTNVNLGLLPADYVELRPTSYPGGGHPVLFASASPDAANDAAGIGRDAGFIRIPKALNPMLRPWLTQWGGPDAMAETSPGDLLGIYGHGTYCCPAVGGVLSRTPADQGRVLVSLGGSVPFVGGAQGAFQGLGHTTGGDSGAAIGILAPNAGRGLRADEALGINTHGIITGGLMDGTLLSKAVSMANARLGFAPVLVEAGDAIVLSGTGPGEVGATITSPADDAIADKGETPTLQVTGTAGFPAEGAGSGGSAATTYYLHRTSCGQTTDRLYMDTTKGAVADAGDGCGSLAAPAGVVVMVLNDNGVPVDVGLATVYPADPAPASTLRFATDRAPHVSVGVSGREGTPVIAGDFEASLWVDGVVVATGAGSATQTSRIEFDLAWTAQAASAPAGSDLEFRFTINEGAGGAYLSYGGDAGSWITIPTAPAAVNAVQLSLDDASFATTLPVTGLASWQASIPLAEVAEGEHTLRARVLQDGVPVAGQEVATTTFTLTGTIDEPDTYNVEVRVHQGGTERLAYTDTTEDYDAEDAARGTWAYVWEPGALAAGTYTVEARLVLGEDLVATSAPTQFTVPSTTTSTTTTTTSSTTTTTSATSTTTSPPSVPVLTSISTPFGPAAGGTLVTLSGSGFTADAVVDFGGLAATDVTVHSASDITARAPAGTAGETVDVTVTQAGGSDTLHNAFSYTSSTGTTSSTASSSGSAGGNANNKAPTVSLQAIAANNLRSNVPHALPFAGVATDLNGCSKLTTVTATLRAPDNTQREQFVQFSDACAPSGDADRAFNGTVHLPAGAPAGVYLLLVEARDQSVGGSAQATFHLRLSNLLQFSYSSGNALRFADFDPGAENVTSTNWLVIENTDDNARDARFDIDDFEGPSQSVALVGNLELHVMLDAHAAAFDGDLVVPYTARDEFLLEVPADTAIAVRLVIRELPSPLSDEAYRSTFSIYEG